MRKTCLTQTPLSPCMALLAVDHIPDAPKATMEMRRVTKAAGIVATTMWDRSRANELYGCFWDAVEAIDTTRSGLSADKGHMVLLKPFHSSGTVLFDRHRSNRLVNALPVFFV